jgi:hypothetical protein
MNLKIAKKLRREAQKLALRVHLAAEQQGKALIHGNQTPKVIYKDLKRGKI